MFLRKFLFSALLLAILLCTGCANDLPAEPEITDSPLSYNTQPTEAEGMTREEWEATSIPSMRCSLGFVGNESGYTYEGGELHIQIQYQTVGCRENGLGIFLFLDGQIQSYRTANETEYTYLHTLYPEDSQGEYSILDVWFTPIAGSVGDQLEMQVASITWPDFFLDQGMVTYQHTRGTTGSARIVTFAAEPEAQPLPSVSDRVISWEITREELTEQELTQWSEVDMLHRHEYEYSLKYNPYNYCRGGATLYSFVPGDYVTFRYESTGNTLGKSGLVVFVDNEPVSVSPEDLIFFQNEEGKRTVVEVTLDLSDFDGSSVVYAFLLGRNYFQEGGGSYEIFRETPRPFYLSGAADLDGLMGWE